MLGSRKGLGEGIRHHGFCWNIADGDAIELYEFVSKMICNMLRSGVEDRILGKSKSSWLTGLLKDFGIDLQSSIVIFSDSQGASWSCPKSGLPPHADRSISQSNIILLTNSYNSIASLSVIFQQKQWWQMPSPRPFQDPNISCSPR